MRKRMCIYIWMTGSLCCTAEIDRHCKSTIIKKNLKKKEHLLLKETTSRQGGLRTAPSFQQEVSQDKGQQLPKNPCKLQLVA